MNAALSLSYRTWFQVRSDSLPTLTFLTFHIDGLAKLRPKSELLVSKFCLRVCLRGVKLNSIYNKVSFSSTWHWSLLITAQHTVVRPLLDTSHHHNYGKRAEGEKIQRNLVFLKSSCILILILFGWSKVVLERRRVRVSGEEDRREWGRAGDGERRLEV